MKTIKLLKTQLILLLVLTNSFGSYAQFGDLLNRAKNKIKNKVEEKISKTITDNAENATTASSEISSGKLYFSNQPFKNATDIANAKTSFVAGDEIYGMVVLESNFSEFTESADQPFGVTFFVNLVNMAGEGSSANTSLQINMHQKYNNQNYLTFDVSPAPAKAISYSEYEFMRIGNVLATVKGNETYGDKPKLGNKRTYDIEFKIGYKEFAKANFDIDYAKATKESMKTWLARETKAHEMSKTNTEKANSDEASAVAKSMPLPKSYSFPNANGYSDPKFSKDKIIAMLKKDPGVKEVLSFKFIKTTSSADFDLFKTPLGEPDYKWGNRCFYFIFKDSKGKCLMSGGRLRLNHEGGGQYGEPFILWQHVKIEKTEGFLEDKDLKAHVVDCGKVK